MVQKKSGMTLPGENPCPSDEQAGNEDVQPAAQADEQGEGQNQQGEGSPDEGAGAMPIAE